MDEQATPTEQLQSWLERIRNGEDGARDELLLHFGARFRRLTRKMLRGFPGVRRWEQTDDVFQNAVLRLLRHLGSVRPQSVREFLRLAGVHIRRELIDLLKHHAGPHGAGAHHATDPQRPDTGGQPGSSPSAADSTGAPDRLAEWTEFHQQVESLPEEEREVFDLLWYQGLTQAQAAGLLGVSERTILRRWMAARLHLQAVLKGELPGA